MEDALKQEVDALRADLQKLATDLKTLTKNIGQRTAAEASEGLDHLKDAGEQIEARLRQAATDTKATLEQQVQHRPFGSLLTAFAIGLLFGKALGR